MSEEREPNDLQQFLMEEDSNARKYSEVTPPISPGVSKQDICSSTGGGCSLRGGISQGSSICSKSLCRIATAPTIGSTHASNSSGTRFAFLNEKMNNRPARPAHPPPPNRIKRVGLLERPAHHHYFLSDVTDVRRMETALLSLLEDFHSGNLRAFGKDCSMEQMTGIREQQERLAKLHFELGASQELFAPLSEEGLSQGKQNMSALMSSLEQLSESIEKLHSFSSQHD
uniref:Coiled-coil domain-containing protein 28B n=1 Tax=Lygus hesperus TaxID=30085 RepID=A0A0A9ZBI1_LYGHE